MNRGTQLLELQEVENDLRDKIGLYKKIQRQLSVDSPVRQARIAFEEAEAEEAAVRAKQQDINLEWQGIIQKVDEEEKRLYSGEIQNPRELEDLQMEVEALKRRRSQLEEVALGLIEEVDQLAQRTAEARSAFERIEVESRERQGELEEKEEQLKRYITQKRRLREKLLTGIDARDLEQYRYVQRLKNDTHAVALLEDGVCGSCHIEVSASKRATVEYAGTAELVTCGNCGRILLG